jgi:translation initiation factor 1 (eIF-1/SUI1)
MEFDLLQSIDNPLKEQEKQLSEINKKISIKFKARNMRKGITTIYGLDIMGFNEKEMNKIASSIKKKFGCASYVKEIEGVVIIEIQGNKTDETKELLVNDFNISVNKISVL